MTTLLPALAEKRVALVIGNSAYQYVAELPNPKNDAEAISASLGRLGFEVIKGIDVNRSEFIKIIRKFSKAIRGADVALLFYAGHGLQVEGKNYLAPVETQLLDEDDLEFETVRLDMVMKMMEREPRTNLVFLDACRNNPLSRNLARSMGTRAAGLGRGLATIETGIGTLIAFATQPGNVALDGDTKHSPFTEALIKHIETPGEDIAVLLRRVRSQVIETTNGKQVPWSNSSLTGSVILKEKSKVIPKPDITGEIAFWNSIKESNDRPVFEAYLSTYKNGIFNKLALVKIDLILQKQEKMRRAMEATLETERRAQAKRLRDKLARLAEEKRTKLAAIDKAELDANQEKLRSEREAKLVASRAEQRALREAELTKERELSAKRKLALVALEKRLAMFESVQKNSQPQKNTSSKNQIQVVRLDQSRSEADIKPPIETIDEKELARQVQKELNRIGCSAGRPDGLWGKGSLRALKQYGRYGKIKLVSLVPSTTLLEQLKAKQTRICPLSCGNGFEKKNDKCVRVKREANLQKSKPITSNQKKTVQKRVPNKRKKDATVAGNKTCYICKDNSRPGSVLVCITGGDPRKYASTGERTNIQCIRK